MESIQYDSCMRTMLLLSGVDERIAIDIDYAIHIQIYALKDVCVRKAAGTFARLSDMSQ